MPSKKSPLRKPKPDNADIVMTADAGYAVPILPPNLVAPEAARRNWLLDKPREVFSKNRDLAGSHPFVGEWLRIRRTFFDDGLCFVGEDAQVWAASEKGTKVRAMVKRLNADLWNEWLLQDNAVVFWLVPKQKSQLPQPMVLDCEVCDYSNGLTGETLKIKVPKKKLTEEENARLPQRWKDAYQSGKEVTLKPEEGERFAVLTRAKLGKGFGLPRLRQAYQLLGTLETLHAADFGGAFQHRKVIEHIKVGREMKFQDALSKPEYFTISKAEKLAIEREVKNKEGAYRAITDIKVSFDWAFMDPKFFDESKYKGTLAQLDRWGGAGMMLLATGEDWLIPFFAAEGRADRDDVGRLLNQLLADSEFLSPKGAPPLRVEWNPNTFRDAKTVLEMLRFAVGQAVMSVTTAREYLALDTTTESKRIEKEQGEPKHFRPAFEPKQGMLTADPQGGRPPENTGGA